MKSIFGLLAFFVLAMAVCATPQTADQLLMPDGTKKSIHCFSLSDDARKNLEAWKTKKGHAGNFSTANYDGFYARLQIKDGMLYLNKIEVNAHSFLRGFHYAGVPLPAIFGKKGPVPADWFSGELYEYFGDDLGYTEVKSNARIYVFKHGRHVETRDIKIGQR